MENLKEMRTWVDGIFNYLDSRSKEIYEKTKELIRKVGTVTENGYIINLTDEQSISVESYKDCCSDLREYDYITKIEFDTEEDVIYLYFSDDEDDFIKYDKMIFNDRLNLIDELLVIFE